VELGKLKWAVGILFGYVVACAMVVAVVHMGSGMPSHLGALGLFWLLVAMFSLPGFLFLRLVFWVTGIKRWFAFALAGSMNGILALWYFTGYFRLHPDFAFIGLLGGLISWAVELAFAGRIAVRQYEG
jgi:hypothetical protein